MGSVNWVCFDCRVAVRRPGHLEGPMPCAQCGAPARNLGMKIRIPPKRATAEWRKLREHLNSRRAAGIDVKRRHRVEARHAFEKELSRLRTRPANKDRGRLIRTLEKRIRDLSD